jgi:pimeloyl-ACP methyl ester carboxylesterase
MQSLSRTRLLTALVLLGVAVLPGGTVSGQPARKKIEGKPVTFNSFDGVELSGTLYINPTGKRDAVVLLLHDFDIKKGGSSQVNWPDLASALHADGFHVLSFDFRGFGDSKNVSKEFWGWRHNGFQHIRNALKKGEKKLDHKNFNSTYLPYLVNDVAAAKAYLDRRNDQKELNSSNIVVIGAGDGATVGALWLANECRLRRDTAMPPIPLPGAAVLAPLEINDVACAVWLSINPTIGKRNGPVVNRWILEAGKANKVPMGFLYGKNDSKADGVARRLVASLKGTSKALPNTTLRAIEATNLAGNDLLQAKLPTEALIRKYLSNIFEDRKSKEQKKRNYEASQYWYVNQMGRPIKIAKPAGKEAPQVDLALWGF